MAVKPEAITNEVAETSPANGAANLSAEMANPPTARSSPPSRRSSGIAIVWVAASVGFVLYLLFGGAVTEAGDRPGRLVRIASLWRRFLDELADAGIPSLVRSGMWLVLVLLIVGAAAGLWFAFTASSDDRSVPDADHA